MENNFFIRIISCECIFQAGLLPGSIILRMKLKITLEKQSQITIFYQRTGKTSEAGRHFDNRKGMR